MNKEKHILTIILTTTLPSNPNDFRTQSRKDISDKFNNENTNTIIYISHTPLIKFYCKFSEGITAFVFIYLPFRRLYTFEHLKRT